MYQVCTRCLMDTSDPDITFTSDGVCSHCHTYAATIASEAYQQKKRPGALEPLVARIRREGQGKEYDCVLGISGGVDSTYLACLAQKLGLRPLAVHLDNGWNSELAVSNIASVLCTLGIELHTRVLDWPEFRDIQLAFLRASTPDSEIPTDHAILAALYEAAVHAGVRCILSGHNTATEGGGVAAWSQGHGDWLYIKSVHRQFGTRPLRDFPHYGIVKFLEYAVVRRIEWIPLLDYVQYDKQQAKEVLKNELGWRDYQAKHFESVYTRFYQGYILPRKFGYDKRRLHLSSLVWSGQIGRAEAEAELREEVYTGQQQADDREFVVKKLGITDAEFQSIMELPRRTFWDYPSYKRRFGHIRPLIRTYHALKRK